MGFLQNIQAQFASWLTPISTPEDRKLFAVIDDGKSSPRIYAEGTHEFSNVLSLLFHSGLSEESFGLGTTNLRGTTEPTGSGPLYLGAKRYRYGGQSKTIRERFLPDPDNVPEILDLISFYDKEVVLLATSFDLMKDFAGDKITVECGNETQLKWLEQLLMALNFNEYTLKTMREYFLRYNVFPFWKVWDPNDPEYSQREEMGFPRGAYVPKWIINLNPSQIIPCRHWGTEILLYCPDENIRNNVYGNLAAIENETLRDVPPEVKKIAQTGRVFPLRDLKPYGFGFSSIYNGKKDEEKWAFPKLFSILDDIELLRILKDVDFNVAIQYKASIFQVTQGPENPKADDKIIGARDLENLLTLYKRQVANKMPIFVTGGDVKFKWVAPPIEIFNADKYASAIRRIVDFLQIPICFLPGEAMQRSGGSFASDYVSLKPLRQKILTAREAIGGEVGALTAILNYWCKMNEKSGAFQGKAKPVAIRFNPNVLTEDKMILEKIKFGWQSGISSYENTCKELGYKPEEMLAAREREIKDGTDKKIYPYFNMSSGAIGGKMPEPTGGAVAQGDPNPKQAGNPRDGGKPSPDNVVRTPRA
jgi:hypothetical protein